jgi:hypothetical protein
MVVAQAVPIPEVVVVVQITETLLTATAATV